MRRLDELGVSPAPWHEDRGCWCWVEAVNGEGVANCRLGREKEAEADANVRLVAAAPCLYEALREAVIEYCHTCDGWHRDGDRCSQADGSCFVQRWRKALEKAGGAE